jgi:hypothetical protein
MPMPTTATRRESPSEPRKGQAPTRDIPAKFRRAPRSTRSGTRLIWVVIMMLLLLMVLALIGLARARRPTRMNATLGRFEPCTLSGGSLSPSWAT